MGALVASGLVVVALVMVLRLGLSGRVSGFSPTRAKMRSRSLRGSNATLMLSAAALSGLTLSIASNVDRWARVADNIAAVLVGALVIAVISLVTFKSADALLGVVGFAAEVVAAALEHGPAGAVAVVVLAALLLMLLGFIRGFVRP
ncbi:MAG: hypothetical protein M3Q48_11705 [Actinomycetota bacterium]|nr:hypothetical protein [Actinomycetota bacterium]